MLILCCCTGLSLGHDYHEETKAWPNCCQSHYHLLVGVILVQVNIIQSEQPLVDTFY